jgi:hypothetical protein
MSYPVVCENCAEGGFPKIGVLSPSLEACGDLGPI